MLKRLFDLTATICGILLVWPLVLLLALLVRTKLGAPMLFRQQRPGLRGQPFMMYKFRTRKSLGAEKSWCLASKLTG